MKTSTRAFVVLMVAVVVAASGLVSPAVALVGGLVFGLTMEHPVRSEAQAAVKFLLQASVVLLGFGMDLSAVLKAGTAGLGYTAISIAAALGLGLLLGKMLAVRPKASLLIACGTAICGGSAIAAIGPVSEASEDEMAVALGTVFSLNAIALLLFPVLGHAFGLGQSQFGLWSALAIHDTSSVVGAAAKYGPQALQVGTTVKLVRSLWIVPVALGVALLMRRAKSGEGKRAKIAVPYFIGLFVLAAAVRSVLPHDGSLWAKLSGLGKNGLDVVLLLIGASLSPAMLKRVGWKPLAQGVALWALVAAGSLMAIRMGWMRV